VNNRTSGADRFVLRRFLPSTIRAWQKMALAEAATNHPAQSRP